MIIGSSIQSLRKIIFLQDKKYFCFLYGHLGYNQITIFPNDQEKFTFTCPFGTYEFKIVTLVLCNAPATFQRYIMFIFTKIIIKFMEVFINNFSIFGDSFGSCLDNLKNLLRRCKETSLFFSWERVILWLEKTLF